MEKPRILLIRTGGTIDAEAYADPRRPPEIVQVRKDGGSLIMAAMRDLPQGERVDEYRWGIAREADFSKDSKLFTHEDARALAEILRADDHRFILVTHGTDAMAANADAVKKYLGETDKTILFTGSMVPLSMAARHGGDAWDNLRFAVENIERLPAGVHLLGRDAKTLRLQFFSPGQAQKDLAQSRESLQLVFRER